jgi:aromatic amino acid aminotransferase I
MTTAMLNKYTFDGYIRWLRGIKALYKMRRNWLCDTFEDVFHIEFEENTNGVVSNQYVREVFEGLGRGVTCYAKPTAGVKKWDEKRGLENAHGPALVYPTYRGHVCLASYSCGSTSRLQAASGKGSGCDKGVDGEIMA